MSNTFQFSASLNVVMIIVMKTFNYVITQHVNVMSTYIKTIMIKLAL